MHDPWPLFLFILLVTAIAVVVQTWRLGAASAREEARGLAATARRSRAADGEAAAFGLLERAGYEVLERQVPGSWTVRADGQALTFGLRADYLVAAAGRRYIAEVKTGRLAPQLSHGPTRRQLLEYGAAFDVDGVLLVDADTGTLTHVEIDAFPPSAARRRGGTSWRTAAVASALSFALGVAVGVAFLGAR